MKYAVDERLRTLRQPLVVPKLILRFWPTHENVLSTTHLLAKTVKAGRGGGSWSAGTHTHRLGGLTTSVLKPNAFSAQSLPFSLPLYPASSHSWERRGNRSPTNFMSGFIPSRSKTLAAWTLTLITKPSVSTSKCRFLPFTFLPGSKPRSSPPTPVVFTLWLSTTPALGCGSRPSRTRALRRRASCSRSQVPLMRQARK
jgi:hypothetical protein